jgi:hypothetical protein
MLSKIGYLSRPKGDDHAGARQMKPGTRKTAERLLKEYPTPQAAAMHAGDMREIEAGNSRTAERHWREVEDAITHFIYHGELPA